MELACSSACTTNQRPCLNDIGDDVTSDIETNSPDGAAASVGCHDDSPEVDDVKPRLFPVSAERRHRHRRHGNAPSPTQFRQQAAPLARCCSLDVASIVANDNGSMTLLSNRLMRVGRLCFFVICPIRGPCDVTHIRRLIHLQGELNVMSLTFFSAVIIPPLLTS